MVDSSGLNPGTEGIGHPHSKRAPILEALAASAGMVVFAFFAHAPLPGFAVAMAGLVLTALAISRSLRSSESSSRLLGVRGATRHLFAWTLAGLAVGSGLALLFRQTYDQTLLPGSFGPFVFVAAAIGAAEELLYRGYIQGRLVVLGWPAAVVLAAMAHTAYKTALFAFPPEGMVIQFSYLVFWTFLAGAAFGLIRHMCRSVLPALSAHVLFDILVYGDWVKAPWWVWG